MPPKNKKNKKDKFDDDDDDNVDPLAMMKRLANLDEDAPTKGAKSNANNKKQSNATNKKRQDDSDDEDDTPKVQPKKDDKKNKSKVEANSEEKDNHKPQQKPSGNKKGGKHNKHDDSDDDDQAAVATVETSAPTLSKTQLKKNKKNEKKNKKLQGGGHQDDSDDDDDNELENIIASTAATKKDKHDKQAKKSVPKKKNKGRQDDSESDSDNSDDNVDDDEESEDEKIDIPKPVNKANKKNQKAEKQKSKAPIKHDNSDSDDEDNSDEEEDEEIDEPVHIPQPIQKSKKDKKKDMNSKNKVSSLSKEKGHDSEDDDENSDDKDEDHDELDEEEDEIEKIPQPNNKKASKHDKKQGKSKGGDKHKKQVVDSDNDSENDESEEEEDKDEVMRKETNTLKSKHVEKVSNDDKKLSSSEKDKKPLESHTASLPTQPQSTTTTTTTSSSNTTSTSSSNTTSTSKEKSSQASSTSGATTTTTTPPPPPTSASSSTSVPVPVPVKESKKPKSKLELKLEQTKLKLQKEAEEKAKKEAEERAEREEQERIQHIENERLAKLKKEQDEKELAERLEQMKLDKENQVQQSDNQEDKSNNNIIQISKNVEPEIQLTEEEIREKEMRMRATMFGDEVFDEHAHPDDSDDFKSSGGKKSKKDDKLSNKARRKLAKEVENKEREAEENALAMKRSAEGAQFAVSQSIIDPNDPQWQNALDIIIPSLSISAHNKELFVNTELNIVHGRRYGLVGPNGAGKSTLLKMIASGELKVPPRIDYLYVEQEVVADETPAVDAVLKADKERWALVQEEKQLLKDLELKADDAKDARLGEIYEQLAQINASSAEAKARRILFGLGFDGEMQVRPTKYFSGGWRMRISLARALFIEPTLLMLDEPTNHLDLNAVIWLDDYLQKWKKTLLIVSHDQDFLNSVCEEIVHLDEKKLVVYRGNYDNFKEQEEVKRKQQQRAWEKQEKKLREMKAKGITKQNAEKEQLKQKAREPGARSKKQEAAAMASGGQESGESQVELIKRPREYVVTFSFPEVAIINPPILEVRDVNFRYAENLPWLFRGLNFGIDMGSRICIVGPNGSGKSTIIKLITGEVNPPEGEVRRNPRLRVGVYNQHFVDRLPMEEDPVTYLRRLFNEVTYQDARNMLGKYGLEGHAHTIPIRDLSGGQKARVVFVELSLMAPHLLFLDEPTNNLDIESIDALCIALKHYNGGVVLVSHDARLIETTDCQLWVVENQNVTPWISGFKDYREHLLVQLEEQLATIIPGGGERPTNKK